MSIPLVSNVGFTEISQSLVDSNSGVLNDIAGTDKSKLPVQIFKLTEAISGNLQMNADAAHKKIILDTNGANLTHSGSPLTNNSSAALELRGSGNVQNLKTSFNVSGSGLGTTTIADTNSSTIERVSDPHYPETSVSGGYQPSFGPHAPNSSSIFVISDGNTGGANNFGSSWRLRVPSGQTWKVGSDILSAGTTLSAAQNNIAIGASSSFDKISAFGVVRNDNPNVGDNPFSRPVSGWQSGFNGGSDNYLIYTMGLGTVDVGDPDQGPNVFVDKQNHLVYDIGNGRWEGRRSTTNASKFTANTSNLGYHSNGRRGNTTPPQTITLLINKQESRRTFTFTNNLSISCVLSGSDPFNTTISAGAALTSTRVGTDDSFDITGTISGSDGSSRPFALGGINNGTGSVDETKYTGIRSASAF